MKKLAIITCIICLNLLMGSFLQAQSLAEKLGGVKTDYIITSHGVELDITNQIISKRAERFHDWGGHNEGAYGYGYGYESFHLEFTVRNGEMDMPQPGGLLKSEKFIVLDFYDDEGSLLGSRTRSVRDVRLISNNTSGNQLMHYSIDLIAIPLPLLDAAKRIDIFRE
ncbi:MAG: hypothetical protein Q4G48_00365 [Bacteroidia bacterium]|nr:hypothetical protein [Bacteroidia bacterium]